MQWEPERSFLFYQRTKKDQHSPNQPFTPHKSNDIDKAEAFADHFRLIHDNKLKGDNSLFTYIINSKVMSFRNGLYNDQVGVEVEEVRTAIIRLQNSKCAGPDSIKTIIVKNLTTCAVSILTNLLNNCLSLGYFPSKWKIAMLFPSLNKAKTPAREPRTVRFHY